MSTEETTRLAAAIAAGRCEEWGSVEVKIRRPDGSLAERVDVEREAAAVAPTAPSAASAVLRST